MTRRRPDADEEGVKRRYRWAPWYRFTDDEADEMRREIQAAVAAGRKPRLGRARRNDRRQHHEHAAVSALRTRS